MSSVPNEIICVHDRSGRRAVALLHWGSRLPLDSDFTAELDLLRHFGRRPVQVTHLKGDGSAALILQLIWEIVLKSEERGATDIVVAVAPDRLGYYERLCFRPLVDGETWWDGAYDERGRSLPVIVLRLALDEVRSGPDRPASLPAARRRGATSFSCSRKGAIQPVGSRHAPASWASESQHSAAR